MAGTGVSGQERRISWSHLCLAKVEPLGTRMVQERLRRRGWLPKASASVPFPVQASHLRVSTA